MGVILAIADGFLFSVSIFGDSLVAESMEASSLIGAPKWEPPVMN